MKRFSLSRICEWGVLAVLAFSIIWKGGKGLESTWLLAYCAGAITLFYALKRVFSISNSDTSSTARKAETPFLLWGMVLTFMCLTVLAYVHSSVRNYGLDTVLRNISLSLIFLWTVRCGLTGKQGTMLPRTVEIMTIAATIATFIGIAVYILQPVDRFVGTFFDYRFDTDYWPNAWGDFVLLAWPLMALQVIQAKIRRQQQAIIACLGMVLGSLLLSYSRGSILAFVLQIGILILSFLYLVLSDVRYKRLFKGNRTMIAGSLLSIMILAGAVFIGINTIRSHFSDVQSVEEKITFTSSEGTTSIDERSMFWHQAFALSKNHPWLGYGPYSFRFVQPQEMTSVLATADHAHNVILNTALDLGWPAAVLFLLIVLYPIASSTKLLLTAKREWSTERDLTSILLIVSVVGVIAHNMIDYNFQFVAVALPFWLCLGFLVVPCPAKNDSAATSFLRWKLSQYFFYGKIVIACALLTVTTIEGGELLISSLGRHAEGTGQIDAALQWYHDARYQWFSRDLHLSEAQLFLEKNDAPAALRALDIYQSQNAFDARGWKLRGMALLREQKNADAEEALNKAYALGKFTDLGILTLLLQTGRDEHIRADLVTRKMEFDTLFSDYADAIEKNTHFIALSQNVEELLSVSRELSILFPTDEKRYKQIAQHANAHAQEERSKLTARAPGILW
jgi:hypothetical protein